MVKTCLKVRTLTAKGLAERVLCLPPFSQVTKEDYKTQLISMIQQDFIELTEEKELIVGLAGEKLLKSFKFYAVFKDSEDFTVRCGSDEIGTITTPPPVGDRFALAGRVWEVEELDYTRRLIYVKSIDGKMNVSWPGEYGEIHTKILERMRRVLKEDVVYPYLKPNAVNRLKQARLLAQKTGLADQLFLPLGGYTWCMFPWLGTKAFRAARRLLGNLAPQFGISGIEYDGCHYMMFKMEKGSADALAEALCRAVNSPEFCADDLVSPAENPLFETRV